MKALLVLTISIALVSFGFAIAAGPAQASAPCVYGNNCIVPCPWYWGCSPCDPSNQCCGPECEPQ